MYPTPPSRLPQRPAAAGFALILTVLLMALLVLVMVSFASLTRVEIQVAANSQKADQARQNALLALNLALGKLQSAAGPDQRITATGGLLSTTHASKQNWTGVWNPTSATPSVPSWLVCDPVPNSATAAPTLASATTYNDDVRGYVRLVGAGTTDTTVAGNEIIVPLQTLTAAVPGLGTTSLPVGRYGWWVGDEGVKARINLADPNAERLATTTGSPAAAAVAPSNEAKRLSLMVPGRTGGELLATDATPPASNPTYLGDSAGAYLATDLSNAASANFLRDLGKVLIPNQVELLGTGFTRAFRQRRFNDFTVSSRGVLADVALGGLKKDLTAAFLGSATEQAKLPDATALFTIPNTTPATAPTTLPAVLPSWGALRSYVQLQNSLVGATPSIAPRATSDTQMGLYPTVARFQLWLQPAVESDKSLRQLYFPAVVLWNPYNVTLAATTYTGMYVGIGCNTLQAKYGSTAWKRGADNFTSNVTVNGQAVSGASRSFLIDCPAIAPGEAIVFTPTANVDYLNSTPAQRTLSPGWRTYFWYQTVSTTSTSSPAPTASDAVGSVILTPQANSGVGFQLYLGSAVSGNNPAGSCLQRSDGVQWQAPAATITISPAPAATPPGLFTGDPTCGWSSPLKMSYQPNIALAQRGDASKNISWLGQYNPAAPYIGRSGTYNFTDNYNWNAASLSASMFPVQCVGNNAYVGYSADDARSPIRAQLFHLPRSETGTLSLAALQHANVHPLSGLITTLIGGTGASYNPARMPAYAIGNSYVDPLVLCSDPDGFPDWGNYSSSSSGFHCDLSFVLNTTLWDKYYFSAVPAIGPPSFPLTNPRHALYDPQNVGASGLVSSLQNVDTAANHLLVEGAFNINSTSREAWRAVLASARKAPVVKQDGGSAAVVSSQYTPIARTSYPLDGAVDGTTTISADKSPVYNGFRSLTDPQLDALATQIVAQVKARAADGSYGPSRSLAGFVNRRPTAATQAYQLKGPLQAAIDATTLNGTPGVISSTTASITTTGTGLNLLGVGDRQLWTLAQPGYTQTQSRFQYGGVPLSAATPGYLTQADLLQLLGSVLSARSDTFRIRTYGEVLDPLSSTPSAPRVQSRAWCEAIVQRVPDYVDSSLSPETDLSSVPDSPAKTTNQTFGRRFKVVSFRWLNPSDL